MSNNMDHMEASCIFHVKVDEDSKKAAKTPSTIYIATLNDCILWIHPWQYEHQLSVNDFLSYIMGNQSGDWLWPFLDEVLVGVMGERQNDMLPTPFWQ
jgi:hypothetical protein